MRDNKILVLIFLPVLISAIVFSSDMDPAGKSVIFAASALCLLLGAYLGSRQSKEIKKE